MLKAQLNPIQNRLQAKLLEAQSLLQNANCSQVQLQASLTVLIKLSSKIKDLKNEILETSSRRKTSDDSTGLVQAITELQLDADEVMSELETRIDNSTTLSTTTASISTHQNLGNSSHIKLPKVELKKFDGDITSFGEFWELFTTSIHNSNITDTEKFVHLKTLLKGDAERLISGFPTSAENYSVAVQLLKERYGDKQQVIQRLYQQLDSLPQATNTTESLRSTYDKMEAILRSLTNLNENVDGGSILNILCKKFPTSILYKVYEMVDSNMTSNQFRKSVKAVILLKEKVDPVAKLTSPTAVSTSNSNPKFTTDAFFTKAHTNIPVKKICRYCEGPHWSDQCTEYPTIETRKTKIKGSCFVCLRDGHNLKNCTTKKKCVYCKQSGNHHRSLCNQHFGPKKSTKAPETTTSENKTPSEPQKTTSCLSCEKKKCKSRLLTATTTITNGQHAAKTRLIFDNGSLRTYITNDLKNKLHLQPLYNEVLEISTFGDHNAKTINTQVFAIPIQLNDGSVFQLHANAVPKITNKFNVVIPPQLRNSHFHKALADDGSNVSADILIGGDYYFQLINEERRQVSEDLLLIDSKFGWVISGNETTDSAVISDIPCFLTVDITNSMKNLWELDVIGVKNINDKEEEEALGDFYKNIRLTNGHYTVTWPWKEFPPDLPTNFGLAYGRLKTLINKMDPPSILEYDTIIQNQLKNGIIEVTEMESANICHYLPHHPVFTPGKSTSQRIVYDGSAKAKKTDKSLNECLYKGKTLLENLSSLILRFRLHEIAIISDIEKAFLQIGLNTRDRDTVRFLWLQDIQKHTLEENLKIFRFCRIPFGVISCPALLELTIHYHLVNTDSKWSSQLIRDFYVDNLITGVSNVDDGQNLYNEAQRIFKLAAMNLRNWKSNSCSLNQHFGSHEETNTKLSVLGIIWNSQTDELSIKPSQQINGTTKREILKGASSVYDPLGWFSPVTLPAKLLLKSLWKQDLDWDEKLTDEEQNLWSSIQNELQKISEKQIPRQCGKSNVNSRLHAFVDASQDAYATVVYIQQENIVNLMFAKARVTPKKPTTLTIPRLELLAILIGTRSLKFVQDAISPLIKIEEIFLWSDSKVALQWVRTNKVLPTFIENRVREIRQHKNIQFRYVPSSDNPADIASRGSTLNELQQSNWWTGPQWLKQSCSKWPTNFIFDITSSIEDGIQSELCLLTVEQDILVSTPFSIKAEKFSCLSRLLTTTATCSKAVSIFLKQPYPDAITRHEQAEILWKKHVQQKYFADVFQAIHQNKPNNLQNQLGLWIDPNGLLRCKGRLQESELSYDEKYPVLIPAKSHFTTLLIMNFHTKLHHVGTSHTLAEMRKYYWIIRGRAVIFHIIKKHCMVCKYFHAKLFKAPPTPPLPHFRVKQGRPFESTGVDVLGPLYIKTFNSNDQKEKVWCMLFTCLTTRAIHLEILSTMTAEDFLLSVRSFIAYRKTPSLFLSDNAPQFKLLASLFQPDLQTLVKSRNVQNFLQEKTMRWKFIPTMAPWMGGAYERLVGLVKLSLKKSLFKTLLTMRQLQVVLTEIASTLNTRPLVYVAPDSEILTPEKLISPYTSVNLDSDDQNPDFITPQSTNISHQIVLSWRKTKAVVNHFWELWKSHYLLSLRERYSQIKQPHRVSQILPYVGQTVIVADENSPRSTWKIARIEELNESEDGVVRSAQLKFPNGMVLTRPIIKLCPLELEVENNQPSNTQTELSKSADDYDIIEVTCEEIEDD